MFIATTNEASQRTQDYMKEGLEQGNSGRGRKAEREGETHKERGGDKMRF